MGPESDWMKRCVMNEKKCHGVVRRCVGNSMPGFLMTMDKVPTLCTHHRIIFGLVPKSYIKPKMRKKYSKCCLKDKIEVK